MTLNLRKLQPALLAASILALLAMVVSLSFTAPAGAEQAKHSSPITGAWDAQVKGAQYEPHLYLFHDDGTMEGTNPQRVQEKPDGSGVNDSVAFGVWHMERGVVVGEFRELNANQSTHKPADTLRVLFRLTVRGNHFEGPAKVFVGTVQVPDAFFTATRIVA